MYICKDCGELAEELEIVREYDPYYDDDHRRGWIDSISDECRWCGGDMQDAIKCPVCDEHFPDEPDEYENVCNNCKGKLLNTELILKFIYKNNLEKEFFVEHWLCSAVVSASTYLLDLCEENFYKQYNLKNCTFKENADDALFEFVDEDYTDFLDDYIKFYKKEMGV